MMKLIIITVVVVLCVDQELQAKILTKAQLKTELRQQGFPESQLNDWVCLVMAESSGNTHAVGPPNKDGSRDYGLFQINNRYWCSSNGKAGNGCNVRCEYVMTDDITKASQCAKKIYKQQGFSAWVGWKNKCKK